MLFRNPIEPQVPSVDHPARKRNRKHLVANGAIQEPWTPPLRAKKHCTACWHHCPIAKRLLSEICNHLEIPSSLHASVEVLVLQHPHLLFAPRPARTAPSQKSDFRAFRSNRMAHIDHTRILSGEQLDDGIVDTLVLALLLTPWQMRRSLVESPKQWAGEWG